MAMRPFVIFVLTFALVNGAMRFKDAKDVQYKPDLPDDLQKQQVDVCEGVLDQELIDEIQAYQATATQIIDFIMNGSFAGRTYFELHDLVDKYPIRMSGVIITVVGHENLELSIDYIIERMTSVHHLDHVRGEQVLVPHWVRGEESAEMTEPWHKHMKILGLGTTVGTPPEGISGEVIVVTSFEDLANKKDNVSGKIVVFNQGWSGYSNGHIYRTQGASQASQFGAIATLIRSVAPFSLDTPHTGGQNYWSNVTHIPTGCITIEDADLMLRLQDKGQTIRVNLKMLDYNLPLTTSRNIIGEIRGTTLPHEFVAVTGHLDSWDLGQGVMDDAGGCMISIMALAALKELGLTPRRTLQTILWTAEEPGLWGVEDFARQHENILTNYSAVFESDEGTFDPVGLDYGGPSFKAGCIVNEILKLTSSIGTTKYQKFDSVSSDISVLIAKGVPGISNNNKNDMYFWYHHTHADTISMADKIELDKNTAMWAVSSYVIADLQEKLPRVD